MAIIHVHEGMQLEDGFAVDYIRKNIIDGKKVAFITTSPVIRNVVSKLEGLDFICVEEYDHYIQCDLLVTTTHYFQNIDIINILVADIITFYDINEPDRFDTYPLE